MSNTIISSALSRPKVAFQNVVIASGATSPAFDVLGGTLSSIFIPLGAASTIMQILVSTDLAGTYVPIYDGDGRYMAVAGDVYELIITAGTVVVPASELVKSFRYFKLSLDSSETNKTFVVGYVPLLSE